MQHAHEDPLKQLKRATIRAEILYTQRRLEKAKARREALPSAEVRTALEVKALHLGQRYRDLEDPFTGWRHQMSDVLSENFRLGQGHA